MAFQANAKNKQKTPMKMKGKKSFGNSRAVDLEDMDSEDDIDNGQIVPVKNTEKNQKDSFVGKKQLTPGNKGKTAPKEFQGMKTNGKRKAQDSEDDDDSDDESDDDIGGAALDLDDLDDEEEDDSDDDDDDDDEEEEDKNIKTGAQNKTKTPIKAKMTPLKSEMISPKGEKSPNKNVQIDSSQKGKKEKNVKTDPQNLSNAVKSIKLTLDQRREQDKKSLFVGNLPIDMEEAELKALSSDILEVRLPKHSKKRKYAFLKFANESKAEENFNILQKKKLRDSDFRLDYVGEKSKMRKHSITANSPEEITKKIDFQKLYVTGLPLETTINQIANLFPKALNIDMNRSPIFRIATVTFITSEKAAEALKANQNAKISGKEINVAYSIRKGKNKKKSQLPKANPAKKAKVADNKDKKFKPAAKKAEVEDTDSDDDDDDEE